ncbi:MAG: hypothetical protein ACOXZ1_00690 [Patescibacteria group bacterium]|jgi:hypothetical protein
MNLRKCLISLTILSLILWGFFVFLLNFLNPETANILNLTLFYFTLFLSLSGTLTLLGFILRRKINKNRLAFYSLKSSFRQSFSFSFLLVATLLMLAQNLFSWFNVIIIILILSILEYIFINEKK